MKIVSAEFVKSATQPSQYPEGILPEIAFAGRSNVGKSSLINTITRKKNLARTSSTPGCTRLINFFTANNQISLVDLPGYGYAKAPIASKKEWGPMIETYLMQRESLESVIVILDVRRDPSEQDLTLIDWLRHYQIIPTIVLTKIDKVSRSQAKVRQRKIKELLGLNADPILFSARTGEGKDAIWGAINDLCTGNISA
ncbi:MAG: ribosome biogenesis GTP-binding protein YihA/YsxC [Syntrophales bacterium]|jgi:GTP-binding protein